MEGKLSDKDEEIIQEVLSGWYANRCIPKDVTNRRQYWNYCHKEHAKYYAKCLLDRIFHAIKKRKAQEAKDAAFADLVAEKVVQKLAQSNIKQ